MATESVTLPASSRGWTISKASVSTASGSPPSSSRR